MAMIDSQYLYSIGRVRELEKKLLSEANLLRIVEADDPWPVLKSLEFFRVGEDLDHQTPSHEIFRRERLQNRQLLHELVAGSPLEDIFLLPYDVENIKLFLKGKLSGNASVKELDVEEGLYHKTELLEAIYEELPTSVFPQFVDAVKQLTEEFPAHRKYALVDSRLDQVLRTMQTEYARRAKSTFLIDYFQRLSDLQNISIIVRRKWHQSEREALGEYLFKSGTLAPSFLERVCEGGWESLTSALKPTVYGKIMTDVMADVNQSSFLPLFDAICANAMMTHLRTAKYLSVGIEPVLAFYLAREHELKLVRLILAGKTFNYSKEHLGSRLRELFE